MHVEQYPDPPLIIIGNDSIEFVTFFIYLGLVLSTVDRLTEINRRHRLATGSMKDVWISIWQQYDVC